MLAYLEAQPAGVARDVLAALCWGDQDDSHARASLRQALYRLRQVVGQEGITTEGETVALAEPLASDRADFLAAITGGDDARACALHAGAFLAGIASASDGDGLGSWEAEQRNRFAALWRSAALRLARSRLTDGDPRAAAALAGEVVEDDAGVVEAWAIWLEALTGPGTSGARQDLIARLEAAIHAGRFAPGDRLAAERLLAGNGNGGPSSSPLVQSELPLVGRDLILDRLLQQATDTERGRPVVMEGAAGLGKSRLLQELAARLGQRSIETLLVTALPSERRNRWGFLTRMVQRVANRPGAMGIEATNAAVLIRLEPGLARQYSAVAVNGAEAPSESELAHAVHDLLGAVQDASPLVLMLDDLHLADPDSLKLLGVVFEQPGAPVPKVIGGTRPGQLALPPSWARWQMTPLDLADTTELVERAILQLPAAVVAPVAEQLLLLTGGVPLYLRRALRLLVDAGLLRHHDGVHTLLGEPQQLVTAIGALSLQSDPRFPQDPIDQRLLGYLAVAEEPVDLTELEGALGRPGTAAVVGRLERLAFEGWIHLHGDSHGASMAHAVIAEQVEATLAPGELTELRGRRADWLRHNGSRLADVQAAVRLYLRSNDRGAALATIREWRRDGGRKASAISDRVVPAEAGPLFRWRLRLAASRREGVTVVALLVGLVAIGAGWNWWMAQPAELRLENTPAMFPVVLDGPTSINQEAPVFTVRNRRGEITSTLDGQPLAVRPVHGFDSVTSGSPITVTDGWVNAEALRLWGHESRSYDSLVATFAVGTLSAGSVRLAHGDSHAALWVVSGNLNGQPISRVRPTVRVAPGDSIEGPVVLHYETSSLPVLWYMAASSTFSGDPPETFAVSSLITGAENATLAQQVSLTAPETPGSHWLVWAFAAENAGEYIFSRTNWPCRTPIWHDGNDLLDFPDDTLAGAWGGGYIGGTRLLCHPGLPRFEDPIVVPVATIKVVVE